MTGTNKQCMFLIHLCIKFSVPGGKKEMGYGGGDRRAGECWWTSLNHWNLGQQAQDRIVCSDQNDP